MQITIKHPTLEQALTARASAAGRTVDAVVQQLLARALDLELEPQWEEPDRNGKIALAAIENGTNDVGLTVHEICKITGWRYRTAADVLQRLLEMHRIVRTRTKKKILLGDSLDRPGTPCWIVAGGAPAWHYRLAQPEALLDEASPDLLPDL